MLLWIVHGFPNCIIYLFIYFTCLFVFIYTFSHRAIQSTLTERRNVNTHLVLHSNSSCREWFLAQWIPSMSAWNGSYCWQRNTNHEHRGKYSYFATSITKRVSIDLVTTMRAFLPRFDMAVPRSLESGSHCCAIQRKLFPRCCSTSWRGIPKSSTDTRHTKGDELEHNAQIQSAPPITNLL